MKKHLSIGLSAFALAALLSGCAGSSGTSTSTAPAAPATSSSAASSSAASSAPAGSSAPAAGAAVIKVAPSKLGQIVVGEKDLTVYYYTKDVKDSGVSACVGGCLTAWPPVVTTSATPTVEGVTGKVGTITTPDGKMQVTINGMPIYYYAKDKAAGEVVGQGVGSVWYVVAPSGEMITTPPSS